MVGTIRPLESVKAFGEVIRNRVILLSPSQQGLTSRILVRSQMGLLVNRPPVNGS